MSLKEKIEKRLNEEIKTLEELLANRKLMLTNLESLKEEELNIYLGTVKWFYKNGNSDS